MGREFEVKYAAKPEAIARIREKYGPFNTIKMRTTYYDTPCGILSRRRWTLRLRMENDLPVCTFKSPAENGARGEWEVECDDIEKAVPMLIAAGAPEDMARLASYGLEEACGVQFTRLAAQIQTGDAVVELALDQGEFLGKSRNLPFSEVEVELKQGPDEAAIAFGAALAQEFGLKLQKKSKYRRALDLAAESDR